MMKVPAFTWFQLLEKEGFSEADLLDGGTGGFHLLGFIQAYKSVIIVDAALDQYPAGHIRILKPKYAKDFPKQLSAHESGLRIYLMQRFYLEICPKYTL